MIVFIITYKRPHTIKTINTLKSAGFTGEYYLVMSDDDPTINEYKEIYGEEKIKVFSKKEIEKIVDTQDNFGIYTSSLYARQFCTEYAKENGIDYFCVLDDDCIGARFRFERDGHLKSIPIKNLDEVFEATRKFLALPNVTTISASIGGAFVGGLNSRPFKEQLYRDGVNSWFQDSNKYIKYSGTAQEDLNIQLLNSPRGMNFFAIANFTLDFEPYYGNPSGGGMCDTYSKLNLYTRQFYSLMLAVSAVKLQTRTKKDGSLTLIRRMDRNKIHPKILSDKYKK